MNCPSVTAPLLVNASRICAWQPGFCGLSLCLPGIILPKPLFFSFMEFCFDWQQCESCGQRENKIGLDVGQVTKEFICDQSWGMQCILHICSVTLSISPFGSCLNLPKSPQLNFTFKNFYIVTTVDSPHLQGFGLRNPAWIPKSMDIQIRRCHVDKMVYICGNCGNCLKRYVRCLNLHKWVGAR